MFRNTATAISSSVLVLSPPCFSAGHRRGPQDGLRMVFVSISISLGIDRLGSKGAWLDSSTGAWLDSTSP